MLNLSSSERYYFYNQATDMRKGCYGLCGIVQNELKKNILLGDVFVFINKRHNQIKLLQWDKDGFALYEKRLEKGCFEKPGNAQNGTDILLTHLQLQHILQGIILQFSGLKKDLLCMPETEVNNGLQPMHGIVIDKYLPSIPSRKISITKAFMSNHC